MGKCGENQYNNERQSQNPTKVKRKPIKVKYISSPMMVKASNAVEFRAIVQQLTGFNSDAALSPTNHKPPPSAAAAAGRTPSSTLLSEEMGVPDDMSSLLELDGGCFGRDQNNLHPNTFLGFQSSCLFQ